MGGEGGRGHPHTGLHLSGESSIDRRMIRLPGNKISARQSSRHPTLSPLNWSSSFVIDLLFCFPSVFTQPFCSIRGHISHVSEMRR